MDNIVGLISKVWPGSGYNNPDEAEAGSADSHSPVQANVQITDVLQKGVIQIRSGSVRSSNLYFVITLNKYFINLTDLTKLETISDQKLLTSFDSINRKEQDKLINIILANKDTVVFEAALRTSWLKNYEPFNKSPTHLLILMMALGHIPIVECLSYSHSNEIDWNFTDQDGNSLFHIALANVKLDPEFMETFFRNKRIELNPFINKITKSNQSLLSMACKRQLQPVIELLINDGASIFIKYSTMERLETGFWILPSFINIQLSTNVAQHVVIYSELANGNFMSSSIANPGKVELLNMNEFTPFNKVSLSQKEILQQILNFPSPSLIQFAFDKYFKEFANLLLLAVEYAHPIVLSTLLKNPNLSQAQKEPTTQNNILHKAILLRKFDNLEILMKESQTFAANLNAKNNMKQTPIDLAIQVQHFRAITIIFKNDKDLMDKQWLNLVENAITNSNIELLQVLMNYFNDKYMGKCMYEKTHQGLSVLHIAVQKCKNAGIFEVILEKYKTQSESRKYIDCRITSQSNDFKGFTPLLLSLKLKQYFATVKLLEAGASSLNEGNLCYFHLLIKSCENKAELNQLLNIELNSSQFSHSNPSHKNKARIWEVTDNECNTLLHYSIKCYNSVAIEVLGSITPFPDLFKPDSKGNSLLHTAVELSQHPIVMDCLVETLKTHRNNTRRYCELLNLQNKNDGYTALMSAVCSNHSRAVKSLIKEGASILPLNHKGDSILHIAAKEGKEEIFQLILDFIDNCKIDKADHLNILHKPNSESCSPIQCAIINGKVGIVKILHEKHDISMCDDKTGYSLLHIAVLLQSIDSQVRKNLIAELLTEKSLLETRDRDGRTPLMLSTINHMVDSINILLPYQPDLLAIDAQGFSLLHNAVISYDKKTFDHILKAISLSKNAQEILNFVDRQKRTVLHYSILENNKEATEEILKHILSLKAQDIEGNTYLHVAAKSPNTVNILKLIIRYAKNRPPNIFLDLLIIQNVQGHTPLLHAICYKNYESCKTLISERANLLYQTVDGPAFHQTINKLYITICQFKTDYYIGYCFPCNGNNTCWILTPLASMETAIHVSIIPIKVFKDLNDDLVKKIVSCPLAQPLQSLLQQVNFSEYSPQRKRSSLYMPASHYGSFPVIRFLLKEHLKLNDLENIDHGSILCEAIYNTNLDILVELCKTIQQQDYNEKIGHILNRKQDSDIYPLELCVQQSKVEAFEYLLNPEFQLQINFRDLNLATIFHYILEKVKVNHTRKRFLEILVTAIEVREEKKPKSTYIADTPLVDCCTLNSGQTPLHVCGSNYLDCISTLLRLNPSPIQGDSSGDTALHLAVRSGHIVCVKEIIEKYKNSGIAEITNKPNDKKQTPLHIAIETGNLEIVKLLLSYQSKLYAVDGEKMTVLHYAVRIKVFSKSENMVEFLLKYETENPEPNESLSTYQDKQGYTPIHLAISCLNVKTIDILLKYPSSRIRDLKGNTILHLAILLDKTKEIFIDIILKSQCKLPFPETSNEDDFVNLKNKQGKTALILAVETRDVKALKQILKYFPLLYLVDKDGNSCLHKAVENPIDLTCLGIFLEIIKERCPNELKSYLNVVNVNGLSPLHHAIKFNHHKAANKLCAYGANIAIQLQDGTLTLCNGKGITFNIVVGPPSSKWKALKNIVWDMKEYYICYNIVDKGISYQIVSLLSDLTKTEITTTNDLKAVTSVTERTLQMICSCHSIEPLIHAIDIGWINFAKEDSENTLQWDVLCGDISDEVTTYLFKKYPEQMTSPKMFKSLENATKRQDKDKVLSFLKKLPNLGDQDITNPKDKKNIKMITENTLAQTVKNSLEYSIDNDNNEILDILLQHGARINHLYEHKVTLLHIIIRKSKPVNFLTSLLEKVRELQSSKSEKQLILGVSIIDHQDVEGKTALLLCIETGNFELLEKLLEYHPDLTLHDTCSNNIVHYVAKLGSDAIANIILKSPPQNLLPKTFYNEANTGGCTPLHLAAGSGNENIFLTILNEGADLYAIDKRGQTVLHHSLEIKEKDKRLTMIELILEHHSGKNVDFVQRQNVDSLSALQITVRLQYENEVDLLLQVDPNTMYLEDKNTSQNSLHLAVSSGNVNILDKIISCLNQQADATNDPLSSDYSIVHKQDKDGKTPVHLSIEKKNLDALIKLLPLSKHCLEISDNFHDTLLHYAVRVSGGSCEYLETVLQEFKSLYTKDFQTRLYPCNSEGFPPLQYAIELNKLQAAIVLFKNSVQLPYLEQRNNILLRSPQSKLSLHIYIEKMKPSKDPHRECWIGFQINISNWIVATLPELSKTEHFDQTNSLLKVYKLNEHQLIAILQCHSTDPFKSAVDSNLITQQLRFDDGSTLLKYVGQFSTKEVIAYFIDWCKCIIFDSTKGESSLIEYAVTNSDPSVLRFLLEKLNPIIDQSLSPLQPNCAEEVRNQYKISLCLKNALELSLNNDNTHALEVLLKFNARYDHTYDQQNTLLHLMVIQHKSCEFIESLLNRACGIEKESTDPGTIRFIDAQNARKETALHLALQMKLETTVKTILKFHPEIISKNSNGYTPLHLSIRLDNFEIIETILNLSQQNLEIINAVNKQNCTPLHLSVDNGDYNVTKLLLSSKANIYCQDGEKKTILHHAIQITDCDRRSVMLNELIKFEDETFSSNKLCTTQDVNGDTPLNLAITKSDHVIVKRLLVFPSVLKVTNELQQTPLHLAVINKDELTTDSILVAIKKTENISEDNIPGKDSIINSQDSTGCTPLHLSIQHRNTDALAKLLAVKPSLGIFNNDGDQALHLAVLSKENAILDIVLDSILRQEVESISWPEQRLTCVRQRDGKTPLHLSIESRNTHALQALLRTKPCLDVCDNNGNTILHYAVKNTFDDSKCLEIILKELKERYSDDYSYFVYFLNSRKLTPLHYSIKLSNTDCIKKLLENQVNLAFPKPCGDMTLLDGIEEFKLSFVKRKDEYWVGYKLFSKSNKTYWIVTSLPDLDHTELESYLSIVTSSEFNLLEVISQSKSTEPLDAALRNKLLDINTSLKHEQKYVHMSQVIARHGSKQSLRCLLDKTNSGLFHRSDKKESMIECAVSNPNIDSLEFLLHSLPPFQEQTDGVGEEPHSNNAQIHSCLKNSFRLSISNSSPCALISLLRFYPKIDCRFIDDNTLIHLMVIDNKPSQFLHPVLEVIREIENSNASCANLQIINHSNFDKKTALHYCVEHKRFELVCILLKFNPDVYLVDENDETPLHYAVNSNVLESVQTLYKYAPCLQQLSSRNKDENAALHLAVKNQNVEIVRYLLECEPPLQLQNNSGSTVLHLAVGIGDSTQRKLIMDALLEHNANKRLNVTCIQDSQLKSPLHLAVTMQYLDIVHSLLAADPKALGIQDNKKQTPFHLTIIPFCSEGQKVIKDDKVFDSLLKVIEQQRKHESKGCDGNHQICIQDERKRTAMHYAIEYHYLHAFTVLLKTGSCLDLPDDDGNTLAHEAVKKNSDVKFLKILVEELEDRYPENKLKYSLTVCS